MPSTDTALCTMKAIEYRHLGDLIAKNIPADVLGEHRAVGEGLEGSPGAIPWSKGL